MDKLKPYYQNENGALYHGDCLEIMPLLPKVDLILADPPYDKHTHSGAICASAKNYNDARFGIKFKHLDNIEFLMNASFACCSKWCLFFCSLEMLGKYQSIAPNKYVRSGIWDRISNTPQFTGDRPAQGCEGIAILHSTRRYMKWNGGGKAAIWRALVERNKKKHPTQKPLALIRTLVNLFLFENEIVLDPFVGSGTTLIACEELNRKWIGVEIDESYCEIAVNRIEKEKQQLKLFTPYESRIKPTQRKIF